MLHVVQGISMDIDDEYDPVACAEQAQQDRQRELEIEAELRVQLQVCLPKPCCRKTFLFCQPSTILEDAFCNGKITSMQTEII